MDDPWALPQVTSEQCNLCGLCIKACPQGSLVLSEHKPVVTEPGECDHCGACEEACPEGAIECAFTIVWEEPTEQTDQAPCNGGQRA